MNKYVKPLDDFVKGILVGAVTVAASAWAIVLLSGCSTRTITIMPDGCINATVSSFLYCPEATVTQVHDGNRTVDMVGEASGVGAVVTEVLKP